MRACFPSLLCRRSPFRRAPPPVLSAAAAAFPPGTDRSHLSALLFLCHDLRPALSRREAHDPDVPSGKEFERRAELLLKIPRTGRARDEPRGEDEIGNKH